MKSKAFNPDLGADKQMVVFHLGQQYKVEHFGINEGSALPFFVSANHSPGKSSKFPSWGNITGGFGEICIRQVNLDFFFTY